jgi:hypothetical protein
MERSAESHCWTTEDIGSVELDVAWRENPDVYAEAVCSGVLSIDNAEKLSNSTDPGRPRGSFGLAVSDDMPEASKEAVQLGLSRAPKWLPVLDEGDMRPLATPIDCARECECEWGCECECEGECDDPEPENRLVLYVDGGEDMPDERRLSPPPPLPSEPLPLPLPSLFPLRLPLALTLASAPGLVLCRSTTAP